MVKAPRSKGCRVCVDRRVKCDQRRPFCLRCQKANRQCPGYETINIVDEGPSVRQLYHNVGRAAKAGVPNIGPGVAQAASRESSASSTSSTSSTIRPENWAPFEYFDVPESSRAGSSPSRSPDKRAPDLERSTLVAIISPSTYQSQLLSSFINTISSSNSGRPAPALHCHSAWMSEIAYRPEVSSTLIWAIRAVSLSYLGLQMQDKNLIQNSRDIYGKALLKLNKSLQDPVEGLSSDTLSATVLLSFYEFMTCTEKNSWVRHAGGAGKLIRLRGPDRHRTGFGSSVFLSCRYTLMIEAFNSKKPCFLALPEWKQLSRELQENSEFQSPFQTVREDIFQEVVDIPGYVTEAVESLTNDSYDSIALRGLIRRGHKHRSNYKDLHARLVNTLRDAGQEPTMTTSATNNKMFSYVYQYPSNIVGSYYCSHWSLTIMINIVLIGLERKLSELSSPDPPISQHQPEVDANPLPPNQSGRGLPLLWMLTEKARRATPPITTTVGSPSDYPTMSEDDTAHRRQLYMAENIACARETCKSVESMSMSVFLGPMFLVYALRNALRVFSDENEKQWIIGKLAAISKNFGIAKHEIDVFKQQEAGREATFA